MSEPAMGKATPSTPPTVPARAERRIDGRTDRLAALDALRAAALLGILLVNIAVFAYPQVLFQDRGVGEDTAADRTAVWIVDAIFNGRTYVLFSFLLGYSVLLTLEAAERRGVRAWPRTWRRAMGLLVLGVAHVVLLFVGDILTTYAVVTLVLYGLRRCEDRTLLAIAGFLLGLLSTLLILAGLATEPLSASQAADAAAQGSRSVAALTGSPGEVVTEHLRQAATIVGAIVLVQGPASLAYALVGVVAARRRWLVPGTVPVQRLRRVVTVCLPVGLAVGVGSVWADATSDAGSLVGFGVVLVAGPALTVALVAAVLLALQGPRADRIVAALGPAGAMSLTNYLAQSVAACLIFTGYGLGLAGRIPMSVVLTGAVGFWLLQLRASAWWMSRHRYGPVERLLRAWTYRT